jgi:hypothetical protein
MVASVLNRRRDTMKPVSQVRLLTHTEIDAVNGGTTALPNTNGALVVASMWTTIAKVDLAIESAKIK